jgi:molybdopterin/thiamine biosynthesis adenylyltransferase
MNKSFHARYDRNFDTFSRQDQDRLAGSSVAIAGLGGLGGGVCEMLARAGIGRLILIDGDSFDITNLNRQILCREDLIGFPKAKAAYERVKLINSDIKAEYEIEYLDENNLYDRIRQADLVMDCLDTIDMRFMLQDAAKKADIPIVSGAIAGVTGQVFVIFPGDKGYELIYGTRASAGSRGIETRTGNISYCALFVAALQASECVKVLLQRGNILRNRILVAELWTNTFEIMDLV